MSAHILISWFRLAESVWPLKLIDVKSTCNVNKIWGFVRYIFRYFDMVKYYLTGNNPDF